MKRYDVYSEPIGSAVAIRARHGVVNAANADRHPVDLRRGQRHRDPVAALGSNLAANVSCSLLADEMTAFDAVDGSSTGTEVSWMWVLLRPPRFGGATHASGHFHYVLRKSAKD